jgi:hypothetical protein
MKNVVCLSAWPRPGTKLYFMWAGLAVSIFFGFNPLSLFLLVGANVGTSTIRRRPFFSSLHQAPYLPGGAVLPRKVKRTRTMRTGTIFSPLRSIGTALLLCPSMYHHHHRHHRRLRCADGLVTTTTSPPILRRRSLLPPPPPPPRLGAANDDEDDGGDGDVGSSPSSESISVTIDTTLSEYNIRRLFAWVKCAFDGGGDDDVYSYYYNNIELAIAASFGNNLPEDSLPAKLLDMAMRKEGLISSTTNDTTATATTTTTTTTTTIAATTEEWENRPIGDVIGRRERESASLGAMGAAQWSGRWMTRPHCESFFFFFSFLRPLPMGAHIARRSSTVV